MLRTALCVAIAALGLLLGTPAKAETPWPADVPGFKAVEPGEHPRLLFRKADLPAIRERAATPEGQAILKRLRLLLNGRDGETGPKTYGTKGPVKQDGSGPHDNDPPGTYTISHVAGYGFLYQITGDKKYADLGREAMDKALEGYRDRDHRYSFKAPYGALRAGPSIGLYALGYDLCYDGWEPAYRAKVAKALADYDEGKWLSLPELVRGARQHPGSNHWGMQVGGGALAVLAIMNDPGVDMTKIKPLLADSQKSMITNMTKGFGDGGFFAEGDGTGSMSSHIIFIPALQAWRVAGGKDFVAPRVNAQWMALKWIFLTVPRGGEMDFPKRGGYPHNIWARSGKSGGGYFGIGYASVTPAQRPALLWFYNHHVKAIDEKNGTPYDCTTLYTHHCILSLVNWPWNETEKNPGEVIPHAYTDTHWKFYAWRNRWQDQNDVVISILTNAAKGNMGAPAERELTVWGDGKKLKWGKINGGFTSDFKPAKDGSTVLVTGDGSSLAIDFSKASGADAMLVMTGPGAPADNVVEAGGQKFSFLLFGKSATAPQAQGNKVAIGAQTVSFDGKQIVLGK